MRYPAHVRYLAIDLGDKRTGLALGDAITRVAVPVDVLEIPIQQGDGAALLAGIARAAAEHLGDPARGAWGSAGEIVLGLPLNMDGTEGPRAKMVRVWAERITRATSRTVHLADERLSSADADWQMARSGMTHAQKKRRRDALAAAAVLRGFLERLPRDSRVDDPLE